MTRGQITFCYNITRVQKSNDEKEKYKLDFGFYIPASASTSVKNRFRDLQKMIHVKGLLTIQKDQQNCKECDEVYMRSKDSIDYPNSVMYDSLQSVINYLISIFKVYFY